jgi:F-type H+-transporting ATPase subunit b
VSPSLATFLFEVANFLLLAAVLGWLFFRPVRDALERRRAALEEQRREAIRQLAEAERRVAKFEARRREFEDSLRAVRAQVRREAEAEGARIVEAAREQAQREHDLVKAELPALRRSHASALAADAAAAAREVLVRLFQHIEGPDLDLALMRAACRELAGLAKGGDLAPGVCETATPLEGEARDLLSASLGPAAGDFQYRVVPELVAGARIVTRRGLVDASATGLAAHAQQSLLEWIQAEEALGG